MQTLSLQDRCLAMRTAATLHRLSLLDEIWTSYLDEAVTIPKRDVAMPGSLIREMRSLLDDAKHQSRLLRKPMAKLSIDWDQRFESLVKISGLSREMKSKVLRRVERDGGVRSVTLKAFASLGVV
jgi:hypothetical protein